MLLPILEQKPAKLSEELAILQKRFAGKSVHLRSIIVALRGRAYTLLLILLALPFITPIPLPGLSTPFGLAIAFIALRLTLGQKPWLPKRLQRLEVPPGFFDRLVRFSRTIIRVLEALLRPRWTTIFTTPGSMKLHAFLILASAVVLLLPLPIPFTNSFPAWAIILTAGGLLERDGLAVLLGYLAFALGTLYFIFLGEAAERFLKTAMHWITG